MDMQTIQVIEQGTDQGMGMAAGLSGALVALGAFIKNYTPINSDWIPSIILVLGVVAYVSTAGPITLSTIITGFGLAFAAVGVHAGTKSTVSAVKPKKKK